MSVDDAIGVAVIFGIGYMIYAKFKGKESPLTRFKEKVSMGDNQNNILRGKE